MDYLIAAVVLAALGYFIYTKLARTAGADQPTEGGAHGDVEAGGKGNDLDLPNQN